MILYRAWVIRRGDPHLYSLVVRSGQWVPGVNQATHESPVPESFHQESAPAPDCICGFWGLGSWRELIAYQPPLFRGFVVYGVIEAWGRIIEHQHGFRCEYATVTGLVELSADIKRIAERYDVPLIDKPPELVAAEELMLRPTHCSSCSPELNPRGPRRNRQHYGVRFGDYRLTIKRDDQPIDNCYEVDIDAGMAWRYETPLRICNTCHVNAAAFIDYGAFTVEQSPVLGGQPTSDRPMQ